MTKQDELTISQIFENRNLIPTSFPYRIKKFVTQNIRTGQMFSGELHKNKKLVGEFHNDGRGGMTTVTLFSKEEREAFKAIEKELNQDAEDIILELTIIHDYIKALKKFVKTKLVLVTNSYEGEYETHLLNGRNYKSALKDIEPNIGPYEYCINEFIEKGW